jgi:hypothetical protein
MINYIVYSNSSYLDVLEIQTDYIKNRGNVTLFIDKNNKDLKYIYDNYNNVIFYKDSEPYSERLFNCLKQYEHDYFLLIHDIDILLDTNNSKLKNILEFMVKNKIDRVDLKYGELVKSSSIVNITNDDTNEWSEISGGDMAEGLFMVKQETPSNYIYNVNPSFWLKSTLLDITGKFKDKTYRNIEGDDVQWYSTNFNIYRLHSNRYKKCGYYNCTDVFVFLHISHNGKFLPLNETKTTVYGQSYEDIYSTYIDMVNKYDLKKSDKWII